MRRGETFPQEAARKHVLTTIAEIEGWRD